MSVPTFEEQLALTSADFDAMLRACIADRMTDKSDVTAFDVREGAARAPLDPCEWDELHGEDLRDLDRFAELEGRL